MNKTSPMMEQYKAVKEQHPDKLLMFQVGDFYEFFFEDARTAAREMEIALTSRDSSSENPIPLAGVPIHAAESYINKLLSRGFKVVICDQVEDSSQAKGLVRREITRILTPGTVTDPEMLDESKNNYLAVILNKNSNYYSLAYVDISTGDFLATEINGDGARETIIDELSRIQPSELLCGSPEIEQLCRKQIGLRNNCLIDLLSYIPDLEEAKNIINEQWGEEIWQKMNMDHYTLACSAVGAVLAYLELLKQIPPDRKHFYRLELYFTHKNMVIDTITSRNLELIQSLRESAKQGSLLYLIDHCMTAMGRRLLRHWIEQPLINRPEIEERLNAVTELVNKPLQRRDLRKILDNIIDLERFCSRLAYQRVNARDLVSLKNTLGQVEVLKKLLAGFETTILKDINSRLASFNDLIDIIDRAIIDEPPLSLKEGGIFKSGYNQEADNLKKLSSEGNNLLIEFEKNERSRTGIKTLRVGYNRNFGYYIEITKTNLNLVPPEYHRKQTLVNAERFINDELHQLELQITGAREKLALLEYKLFEDLRNEINIFNELLLSAAHELAFFDCLQSLAETAVRNNYSRPTFTEDNKIIIKQLRHPVVEQLAAEQFVPNDVKIDNNQLVLLITGPNMAGKSTYIRSVALVPVLAQMGSFVPALKAELPIVDRVFARVGASDDLSRGQSTFMVEMQETAGILKEATAESLIILDEIGRGTSTYDGMSIARSVLEYICKQVKAKTLFSTHYHELTKLEGEVPGIKNYTMAVKEKGKQVIFLRQVVPGRSDKSYGINVARLAGVPLEVLIRAEKILFELELASSSLDEQQLSLLPMVSEPFDDHKKELEVIEQLKELDLNRLTPLESLQKLYELQSTLISPQQDNNFGKEN